MKRAQGDMPLPQAGQSSLQQIDSFEAYTYISVEDLTDDEIADIKKYIEFIKSKRGSGTFSTEGNVNVSRRIH